MELGLCPCLPLIWVLAPRDRPCRDKLFLLLRVQAWGLCGSGHGQCHGTVGGEELHIIPGSLHLPTEPGHAGDARAAWAGPYTQPHRLLSPGLGLRPQTSTLL